MAAAKGNCPLLAMSPPIIRPPMLFFRFKAQHYKAYTMKDLLFEGVTVKNVEFDRLVTYFDKYYADLTNIKVRQSGLWISEEYVFLGASPDDK
jgi:hypothetical protein